MLTGSFSPSKRTTSRLPRLRRSTCACLPSRDASAPCARSTNTCSTRAPVEIDTPAASRQGS
jgi:hypothetical protein